MSKLKRPRIVFQPKTYQCMQRGINLMANAIRPTLGPLPRNVAIDPVVKTESQSFAELLDDGGLIARRIQQLADADADVGAMFMRQVIWQQHLRVGDGTAVTAVLFQSIYNQGLKYIASGGNAMRSRKYLENGMRVVINHLNQMTCPLDDEQSLIEVARSVCHDESLAKVLGEVFDVIGPWGQLETRAGHGLSMNHEYYVGTFFKSGILSAHFINDHLDARVEIDEAAILLTDLELTEPSQIIPSFKQIYDSGCKGLLLVARSVSDKVMGVLLSINNQLAPFKVIAVKAPDALNGLPEFIQDLEVLTGGHAYLQAAGENLESFTLEDLGAARKIWADKTFTGLNGGKGEAPKIISHIEKLKAAYMSAEKPENRQKLLSRINLFMGGAALIWVGGMNALAIKARKELIERTAQVIRISLMSGKLPGGGVSLLACRPALDRLAGTAQDLDEQAAYRILSCAMEEPLRTILMNGGHTPGPIMHDIQAGGQGYGFDLHSEQIVNMFDVGIIDSAEVIKAAVQTAIASAALALTVDVMVHHRKPETAYEP